MLLYLFVALCAVVYMKWVFETRNVRKTINLSPNQVPTSIPAQPTEFLKHPTTAIQEIPGSIPGYILEMFLEV